MMFGKRIRTIYAKELREILRDQRTLIAMIVVPIALYPLLIIGSVHLLSMQEGRRQIDELHIAVRAVVDGKDDFRPEEFLGEGLHVARRLTQDNAAGYPPDLVAEELESIDKMRIVPVADVPAAVTAGQCQIGVTLQTVPGPEGEPPQYRLVVHYDQAELRSEAGRQRLTSALELVATDWRRRNIAAHAVAPGVVDPLIVEASNVATPRKVGGMVLGGIVPLVLVLMTITGAIYPAIDLTAGERERGTLETLLVCPVPPVEVITGKYLVVTTIALLGAALNLGSVGATLYLGGFTRLISPEGRTELPLGTLPIILLAMVPFALLFSAVLVAVCSYARTFKEAQNYIVPVIIAALIPGGIAALPGTELSGANAVVPVMNMVLLARELLLGKWPWGNIALVLLSTTLYAVAAVAVASRVFSAEQVVFADSGSLRAAFTRRLIRPSKLPSATLAAIVVALLFPLWFFVQLAVQPQGAQSFLPALVHTAQLMPVCFVLLPVAVLWYWRIELTHSLALRAPPLGVVIGAVLLGCAAWVPAHEVFVLQSRLLPVPAQLLESEAVLRDAFAGHSPWLAIFLMAVVPGCCEELLFRGFLLSGLRGVLRRWPALILVGVIFAVFHLYPAKFLHTVLLGVMLGYVCWQGGSIWPAVLAHVLHNSTAVALAFWPRLSEFLRLPTGQALDHLPPHVIAGGLVLVGLGLLLVSRGRPRVVV